MVAPIIKASTWCASWRLCAGSASTHAKVPALTAIINSKPNRNPPTVAARTNAMRGKDIGVVLEHSTFDPNRRLGVISYLLML
jgi:hypothetical protein